MLAKRIEEPLIVNILAYALRNACVVDFHLVLVVVGSWIALLLAERIESTFRVNVFADRLEVREIVAGLFRILIVGDVLGLDCSQQHK